MIIPFANTLDEIDFRRVSSMFVVFRIALGQIFNFGS
jgi:hypothetical protein